MYHKFYNSLLITFFLLFLLRKKSLCISWLSFRVIIYWKFIWIKIKFKFSSGTCYIFVFFVIILQFWPLILNVISPLNESRSYKLFIVAEYFVNQEKYYYAILLHSSLALYIGVIGLCSTGVTFVTYILHLCALLKIAR